LELLTNYAVSLNIAEQAAKGDPSNKEGKKIIHEGVIARKHVKRRWDKCCSRQARMARSTRGVGKAQSDAGFRSDNGDASTGVVVRDSHGQVLLTAWRSLRNVASVSRGFGSLRNGSSNRRKSKQTAQP
jgi:hypothetical protein